MDGLGYGALIRPHEWPIETVCRAFSGDDLIVPHGSTIQSDEDMFMSKNFSSRHRNENLSDVAACDERLYYGATTEARSALHIVPDAAIELSIIYFSAKNLIVPCGCTIQSY